MACLWQVFQLFVATQNPLGQNRQTGLTAELEEGGAPSISLAVFRRFVHRIGLTDYKYDQHIGQLYSSCLLHQNEERLQVSFSCFRFLLLGFPTRTLVVMCWWWWWLVVEIEVMMVVVVVVVVVVVMVVMVMVMVAGNGAGNGGCWPG